MAYDVWKSKELANKFISGIRKAIPLADEQIYIMLKIISYSNLNIDKILDLGCGDGILTASILEYYPKASAILVDISEPMINIATKKLSNYQKNLEFMIADCGDITWIENIRPKAPFDLVVSGFMIHHLSHQRKKELYREIFSILKPGGLFLNLEHVASSSEWVSSIFGEIFIDSLYNMHASKKTRQEVADEFYNRDDKESNILAPVEIQCEWLKEIGFSDVDCYFKIFEIALFGGRKPRL